ncbi:3-phosphoshikimate 1-carboxyvinyltransferase [Campylobacter sp.]|uniref:3-phosphoshikimate 1-carboxyvinyltransferase n=1 Tax=Campylobacter sp. TaxID=205 RepID=UPI0026DCE07F|nr:3-phosphoshikimate 1-carboxyvinyltransferase [Campylobacter sp.]MDO4674255.1 3-phosphoshikimate 1-carboxyvinyltransferase [Campylobacter sp.]
MKIRPLSNFNTTLEKIAADKSLSHRFAIFSLLSKERSRAKNYLLAEDTLNTLKIIENLGAGVEKSGDEISITPPAEFKEPNCVLDCGNSGTAMRLMLGFLAGLEGKFFTLSGDKYLNERPMGRVCEPLGQIGAQIYGRSGAKLAPLCVLGRGLRHFDFVSEISSAQVKTAMILAGFRADATCYFREKSLSRDHSEKMLLAMDAPLKISEDGLGIEITPLQRPLKALNFTLPNDPSSVFYFVLAALILPNSSICVKNVLLNPTRIEAYKILKKMGAKIDLACEANHFEPVGTIHAQSSELVGVEVDENIAWLIDEAPALAIAFALAKGKSSLKNAKELRVKESDRIRAVVANLQKCGIEARELEDGFEVEGGKPKSAKIQSFGDHRIAMSFMILGLICGMELDDVGCIGTSFPNFCQILESLGAEIDH